jgi:hypothetical protein
MVAFLVKTLKIILSFIYFGLFHFNFPFFISKKCTFLISVKLKSISFPFCYTEFYNQGLSLLFIALKESFGIKKIMNLVIKQCEPSTLIRYNVTYPKRIDTLVQCKIHLKGLCRCVLYQ